MGLLDGRVVIVTGGGRGLGRNHCLELAANGAVVVVNDVGSSLQGEATGSSPAELVVKEIEAAGGRARASAVSVTDHDAVGGLVREVVAEEGRLDAIVNNAGIIRDKMLTTMTEDDFDAVLAVHLKGTWSLTKHAVDHWREAKKAGRAVSGRIVNTTSGTGLFGNVGQANYGAAKAAIANLTMITAMEAERYGVTANAISPIARTRMTEALPSMQARAEGTWDRYDAANASPVVAWLASEASGWLSGVVLRVDGSTVQRVLPWQVDPAVSYTAGSGTRLTTDELGVGLRRAFGTFPRGMPAGGITR